MTEFTQKLLILDSLIDEELKLSNKLAQETIADVDTAMQKMMNEAQDILERRKKEDLERLTKNLQTIDQQGKEALKKNMQDFDECFDIDTLVKNLILVAKEKVCP